MTILKDLSNFIFILCLLHSTVFIFEVVSSLRQTEPKTIEKNNTEKILLYLSFSFIIFYLFN